MTVNGQAHRIPDDPRVTLLDLLRESLGLTGTKKGCDHGQCGACTVLVNGRRVLSCLSLAVAHDGDDVTTIEGLAHGDRLHPVQAAFIEHDGLPVRVLHAGPDLLRRRAAPRAVATGTASAVTADVRDLRPVDLTDDEIRERMSGNLCRCGA